MFRRSWLGAGASRAGVGADVGVIALVIVVGGLCNGVLWRDFALEVALDKGALGRGVVGSGALIIGTG